MIRRHQHDESGYTLLLVLLLIVVFMTLALSAVMMTMSGMKKNTVREEYVQATELADKGLLHITKEINAQLEARLGEYGLPRQQFIQELEDVLANYTCEENTIQVKGKTGKYEACINGGWENVINRDGTVNELRKLVSFKSVGFVEGRERTFHSNVEIGAKTVPEALKYAIGSHQADGSIPGEGNLFLHGGVTIEGDLKVDKHVITSDKGYAYLGRDEWIDSLSPEILPSGNTNKAKLVLGGDLYTVDPPTNHYNWQRNWYKNHIQRTKFSNNRYEKHYRPEEVFSQAPNIVSRSPNQEEIRINEQKKNHFYEKSEIDHPANILDEKKLTTGNRYAKEKVYADGAKECSWFWCQDVQEYILQGNNTFKKFATEKSLVNRAGTTSIAETMYVGGDLFIGNGSNSYHPNYYDKIQMEGSIYVNGDLTIKGADATFNTLMYVNGDVTIENTQIKGVKEDGEEQSLIIFANGNIHIRNNSVNQDKPSKIRGFFYSKSDFEMFGVGSNMYIDGGISARRVVLNAIRGRARDNRFFGAQYIGGSYFEGRENQLDMPSRLQIIYNPEIINTYSDLKEEEPVIYDVDPPLVKERH
ncbi:hypothetical protein [Virgibacillus dokdonensis]|uniref:hypothetical protein n=1 Tax=Virgibacillus dokdonensis TaxID=302167 RepID=UPI000989D104|nr:hypothetical protein [Virgibacillus dokdonensis]